MSQQDAKPIKRTKQKKQEKPAEEDEAEVKRPLNPAFGKQARLFVDYINFDWEEDKDWLKFVEDNPDIIKDARDKETARREYFKLHYHE